MTDLHKAATMALEALERCTKYTDEDYAAITALREALAAPVVPPGYALVPKRMTPAMRDVTDQDDWDWPDLLAAAEAVTEEDYLALCSEPDEVVPVLPEHQQVIEAWTWFDVSGNYHLSRNEPADYTMAMQITPLVAAAPKPKGTP